jgi:hypothetical protein
LSLSSLFGKRWIGGDGKSGFWPADEDSGSRLGDKKCEEGIFCKATSTEKQSARSARGQDNVLSVTVLNRYSWYPRVFGKGDHVLNALQLVSVRNAKGMAMWTG